MNKIISKIPAKEIIHVHMKVDDIKLVYAQPTKQA